MKKWFLTILFLLVPAMAWTQPPGPPPTPTPIPEPGTLLLVGSGLGLLWGIKKRMDK